MEMLEKIMDQVVDKQNEDDSAKEWFVYSGHLWAKTPQEHFRAIQNWALALL